ncbi:MAG: LLM class F420-dependent oxidoreductase, partial [Chloroflexota bacterium]|nr:LLM class F420-dependent oxidoreductase [Chloroflexota bacterium]
PSTMPRLIQIHISWAESDQAALDQAVTEWPNGGMNFPKQDIRTPEDFAAMAKLVRPENFKGRVLCSADLDVHREHVQHYLDMGFDEVYIHNVGRNQTEFIEAFGKQVIPQLNLERAEAVATS